MLQEVAVVAGESYYPLHTAQLHNCKLPTAHGTLHTAHYTWQKLHTARTVHQMPTAYLLIVQLQVFNWAFYICPIVKMHSSSEDFLAVMHSVYIFIYNVVSFCTWVFDTQCTLVCSQCSVDIGLHTVLVVFLRQCRHWFAVQVQTLHTEKCEHSTLLC